MNGLTIYGATGYSGRLLVARACELGLRPVLSGRDEEKLKLVAAPQGLEYRTASLSNPDALVAAFEGARVVLNAAGPFVETAEKVLNACERAGVHYTDISGEPLVIDRLAGRHALARERKIMIMPAVGFDVVPTDCLAAHVKRRLPRARRLRLAITHPKVMSAGSAKTLVANVGLGLVRRDGVLKEVPLASRARTFDYGDGPCRSLSISLADVITAYYTTGIPDIETYLQASPIVATALGICRAAAETLTSPTWQTWLGTLAALVPEPAVPDDGDMMCVVAEAEDDRGIRVVSRLRTSGAYRFTALAAIAVVRRVLEGDAEPGFQTPARVYGSEFVLSLPEVSREDLE